MVCSAASRISAISGVPYQTIAETTTQKLAGRIAQPGDVAVEHADPDQDVVDDAEIAVEHVDEQQRRRPPAA